MLSFHFISLHFCASFTWRQLTGPLYVVFHSWRQHHRLTFRLSTSQHFCFALHFETTLSFHFVPCHFTLFLHFTLFFTLLGDNFVVSFCTSSLHSFSHHTPFVFHFTWRQLRRFTLYLVTSLLFFTSHHFCFSLHFGATLSFHFVSRYFSPVFHLTSLLFFTSLGDSFVVSLCTSSLHSFSYHITFVFHFTWKQLRRFTFVPYHFTSFLHFTPLLFSTSFRDNFVVSLCTLSLSGLYRYTPVPFFTSVRVSFRILLYT